MSRDFYQRVYDLVRKVPSGRIVTYGQVAAMLGSPQAARTVGYALNALRSGSVFPPVPWQRVINAQGRISLPPGGGFEMQRDILKDEGVEADEKGVYDMSLYRWDGNY